MSIRNKIYQSAFPYHIYNRVNNQEHLFDLDLCFPIFMTCLKVAVKRTGLQPHHFILMNNHYHLIASTPKANLHKCMHVFHLLASQMINKSLQRKNHIFGSRYGATVVNSERYLCMLIRYVYQNPLRAQITKDVFSYQYSTLPAYLNDSWSREGVFIDPFLKALPVESMKDTLQSFCVDELDVATYGKLKKGLRRNSF